MLLRKIKEPDACDIRKECKENLLLKGAVRVKIGEGGHECIEVESVILFCSSLGPVLNLRNPLSLVRITQLNR